MLLSCQLILAQNEPYFGGTGRGDIHNTQLNVLLGDHLIYSGGDGRGDIQLSKNNTSLGETLIYFGGIGSGDIMKAVTSQLNNEQIWIGPTAAGNDLFSNGANWALGYTPKIGNIKIDNLAVRDMQLVSNVYFDTLFFENNTTIKTKLGNYNFKLKHFSASTNRQLFQTNGSGSVVIPEFNNGKSLKFHIGESDYNPITITNYNTTIDSIAVRVQDAVLTEAYNGSLLNSPNVQRTWFIKKNNANSLGVDFIYEWDTTQQSGFMPGYYLNHFDGSNWEVSDFDTYETPIHSGSRVSLALNGYFGGFSPFTFGDSPLSPLPIDLLSFNAVVKDRIIEIYWQTASEHNNDFFTIERSKDGYYFEPILYKDGAGNSNSLISYSDKDLEPLEGISYYRLKQTDFDGAFDYSDIRVVSNDGNEQFLIYPNPCKSGKINFSKSSEIGNISVFSSEGKLLFSEYVFQSIDIVLLPGIYFVHVLNNEKVESRILVVSK